MGERWERNMASEFYNTLQVIAVCSQDWDSQDWKVRAKYTDCQLLEWYWNISSTTDQFGFVMLKGQLRLPLTVKKQRRLSSKVVFLFHDVPFLEEGGHGCKSRALNPGSTIRASDISLWPSILICKTTRMTIIFLMELLRASMNSA